MYFKGLHICPCTFQNLNSIVNWHICGIIYGKVYRDWKGHSHTDCNLRCFKFDMAWRQQCRQQAGSITQSEDSEEPQMKQWRGPALLKHKCGFQVSGRTALSNHKNKSFATYAYNFVLFFFRNHSGKDRSETFLWNNFLIPVYKGCTGKRGIQACVGICMQRGAGRGISHQMLSRYKWTF